MAHHILISLFFFWFWFIVAHMLMVIEHCFILLAGFGRVDEIESIDADSAICDNIKTFKKGKTFFEFFSLSLLFCFRRVDQIRECVFCFAADLRMKPKITNILSCDKIFVILKSKTKTRNRTHFDVFSQSLVDK